MAINLTQQTQIIQLTVGMFDAAPGAVHMNDFADYVSGGGSIQGLANALAATSTFQSASFYPASLSSSEFATRYIDNLVGGTATAADKSWAAGQIVGKLAAGESRGDAMHWAITALAGVSAGDAAWGAAATQFANKVTVASHYTLTAGGTVTDVSTLQTVVASVTNDPATVSDAILGIDSGTIGGAGGLTIALTTGLNVTTAGSGNDSINAGLGALQTGDVIDGGAGIDTLTISDASGAGLASIRNVEQINLISLGTGHLNLADAAGYTSLNVWGSGSSATIDGIATGLNLKIGVASGFGGGLTVGFKEETGANDTLTLYVDNASGFVLNERGHAIETINFQVVHTAYAASASEFGTATKAFNIQGDQNVTMRLRADSANTALTISSTALTAGNLNLAIDAISGNQQLDVRLGTGNDVLVLASGVFHDNMTAVIDAGAGSDSFSMFVETTATLAPSVRNFEAVTLAFENPRGTFNASGVSGAETLVVLVGSGLGSSVNITNLPGEVSALTIGVVTGSAVASARVDVSLVEDSSDLTLLIDASRASAATALFGTIGVTGARGLVLQPGGSGNVQLNDLYADGAPKLAINMLASSVDLTLSALCAGGASSVLINATAGDFQAIALGFGTAREVTINQAGSHDYSGVHINNLYAPLGDLAITVAGASGSSATAGVIIDTATVGDRATITTHGGDVQIGDLRMAASSLGSNATGNVRLTLAANGSADYILINSLGVGTGGTAYSGGHNLIVTISGSGDVTLGSVVAWTGNASNGAENVVSAAELHGTLVFGASAASAGMNYAISLGADQASANSVAVGRGNDTVYGGGNRDTIEGGDGEDTLRGGGGSDVFAFLSSAGDFADARSGQKDFIMDFASGDRIVFSGIRQLTSDAGYTSLSGLGDVSAISTATLIGTTVKSAVMAIYQASGSVYIEVALQTQAVANDDGVMTIVLDGSRWTALSGMINVSVGGSGLYIVHL